MIFLSNYRIVVDDQIKFELLNGDVVLDKADILVNSSNQHLLHDGGCAKNYNLRSGKNENNEYNL